jgi:hypothetical protein
MLLEGAEDWDWGDMDADFLTPKKAPIKKPIQVLTVTMLFPCSFFRKSSTTIPHVSPYVRETCTRCIVESIAEVDADGQFQKVSSLLEYCCLSALNFLRPQSLTVRLDPGDERRSVILRDDWTALDIRIGKQLFEPSV